MPSTQAPPPVTPMEMTPGKDKGEGPLQTNTQVEPLPASQDRVLSTSDITAQMKELEKALSSSPETAAKSKTPDSSSTQTPESSSVQTLASSQLQQRDSSQSEPKELQEGQEIYIQTEGLTVQLAEPGLDRIVIVNGPDGTTMHIQTPEGVPLEAVQALLGIEASDGAKTPQWTLNRIQTDLDQERPELDLNHITLTGRAWIFKVVLIRWYELPGAVGRHYLQLRVLYVQTGAADICSWPRPGPTNTRIHKTSAPTTIWKFNEHLSISVSLGVEHKHMSACPIPVSISCSKFNNVSCSAPSGQTTL